jgi:uncharacterized protein (TIGR02265 family)
VPISEEVRLIELALDLLSEAELSPSERAREAGRLHFQNFATTPYARVLFTLFPRNFRYMMLHAKTVAERVFKGVRFDVHDLGPDRVELVMENADYPIEHFEGLFQEWMRHFDLDGIVHAIKDDGGRYRYQMEWSK